MKRLELDEFSEFFAEINDFRPFRWQTRLLHFVMDNGRWPDAITAPTGAGKSNVVDVHVFANALLGYGVGPRIPRRLAVVVGRRAIVDSHLSHSLHIAERLRAADPDSVSARVAEGLRRLRAPSDSSEPLTVSVLRGGLARDSNWIDDPSACAVICATPDMFGSRLLFGGYGSSRYSKPREAGVLARDTVMVLDEAHLNAQLLATVRRVKELQSSAAGQVPAVQVVATTATPAAGDKDVVGVKGDDLVADRVLADRLEKPKPVRLVASEHWPGARKPSRNYANEIAGLVTEQVAAQADAGTVGCVVNSVFTAQQVARTLRTQLGSTAVILWVGPMRPLDLALRRAEHPNAFTVKGDPEIRVIVATQTVEVGVDIDFASLITELAPGSSLVQRAGRVNRLGVRPSGQCTVVVPAAEPSAPSGPYSQSDLAEAYVWLHRRASDPGGVAPVRLQEDPAPPQALRRPMLARLERGDVDLLSATSETAVAEIDLKLWLRDDLDDEDSRVGIVCRRPLPVDDLDALELLRATPVAADEVYPASIGAARTVFEVVVAKAKSPHARLFRWRAGDVATVDPSVLERSDIAPGDVFVVDGQHSIVDDGVIVASDGHMPERTSWGAPGLLPKVLVDGNGDDWLDLRDATRAMRDVAADPPSDSASDEAVQVAAEDVLAATVDTDVPLRIIVPRIADGQQRISWAVIAAADSDKVDDEARQTWNGNSSGVTLETHRSAVAARAEAIATSVGLAPAVVDALREAGRLHDEGKQHPAFQRILSAPAGVILAKSADRDAGGPRRARSRVELVRGWRHEQLSVVYAAVELQDEDVERRDLVLRLVGSSHGRGRTGFEHSATELLAGRTPELLGVAVDLFDEGGWDELIEATDRRWGAWECAYLEAVLRAADCMVSKEGS